MKRLSVLLLFVLFSGSLVAGNQSAYEGLAEKSYAEEFKVDKDAMLKVSNMFGSIEIINWNENTVSLKVDISIETSSDQKAQRVLDGINVNFNGTRSLVEAYTEMEKNICNNGCNIQVDYTIKIPSSMKVDLLQRFGDIRLEELNAEAKIGVKYGDIVARRLNASNNEVFVKFGNAELELIKSGKLQIEYSEVSVDEAENLEITSSYSELSIDKIQDLLISSSYDEIEISQVERLDIESGFTESEIDYIGDKLKAKLRYGGMEVNEVSKDFSSIDIDTEFADVELGMSSNASYQLGAETKFGDVEYPDNSRISIEKKGYTENRYKGFVGDDSGASASVLIYAKHANIELD